MVNNNPTHQREEYCVYDHNLQYKNQIQQLFCLIIGMMSVDIAISTSQWRFAPLNVAASSDNQVPTLKGIVFDVDGTLW